MAVLWSELGPCRGQVRGEDRHFINVLHLIAILHWLRLTGGAGKLLDRRGKSAHGPTYFA